MGARGSHAVTFECFDTVNSITIYGYPDAPRLLGGLKRMCLHFDALWSFAHPGSDVSRISAEVRRVEVDPLTADLLRRGLALQAAEPAFDMTVGQASYLWKRAQRIPSAGELAEAMHHVGAGGLHVEGGAVVKDDPLLQVDVGGFAKGYIADAIVWQLRRAGVVCADVDLGGNLYVIGDHPDGRPWRFDVFVPDGVPAPPVRFEASDTSVVTSGSYERFVLLDGVRYSHLVDARTGWPTDSDVVSATVVDACSLRADLLASALLLEGSRGFEACAVRNPESGMVAVTEAGEVLASGIDLL